MYRDKTISLVIPCYNEEEGLRQLLPKIPDIVDEVLIVDNASTDNTARVARELGARVVGERVGTSKLNIWRDGILNLLFLFKKRLGFV